MTLKIQGIPFASDPKSPFNKLSHNAESLNDATGRLNDAVEKLDVALKKLNLGIPAWVEISSWEDGPFAETEEIGYDRVEGKWGICLRTTSEDRSTPVGDGYEAEVTPWHFARAPRDLRIRGVKYLNELIEKLNAAAETAAEKIVERAANTETLAEQIAAVAESAAAKRTAQKKGGK